jgi:hypothetical protein
MDVSEVRAMDVSRNGAQRSGDERNRPQRQPSDDKRISSTIVAQRVIVLCAENYRPLRKGLSSVAQEIISRCAGIRKVVAAGDYVHASTPLRSVLAFTSIAPTRAAIASVAIAVETHNTSNTLKLPSKTSGHFTQNIRTISPKLPDISPKTSGHSNPNSLMFSPQSYAQIPLNRTYKLPKSKLQISSIVRTNPLNHNYKSLQS